MVAGRAHGAERRRRPRPRAARRPRSARRRRRGGPPRPSCALDAGVGVDPAAAGCGDVVEAVEVPRRVHPLEVGARRRDAARAATSASATPAAVAPVDDRLQPRRPLRVAAARSRCSRYAGWVANSTVTRSTLKSAGCPDTRRRTIGRAPVPGEYRHGREGPTAPGARRARTAGPGAAMGVRPRRRAAGARRPGHRPDGRRDPRLGRHARPPTDPTSAHVRTGALFADAADRFAAAGFDGHRHARPAAHRPRRSRRPARRRTRADRAAAGAPPRRGGARSTVPRSATRGATTPTTSPRSAGRRRCTGPAPGSCAGRRRAGELVRASRSPAPPPATATCSGSRSRPSHQGQGHGRALVLDSLRWMRARRLGHGLVNTAVDNERALAPVRVGRLPPAPRPPRRDAARRHRARSSRVRERASSASARRRCSSPPWSRRGRATTADAAVDATLTLTAQPFAIARRRVVDGRRSTSSAISAPPPARRRRPRRRPPSTASTPSAPSTPSSSPAHRRGPRAGAPTCSTIEPTLRGSARRRRAAGRLPARRARDLDRHRPEQADVRRRRPDDQRPGHAGRAGARPPWPLPRHRRPARRRRGRRRATSRSSNASRSTRTPTPAAAASPSSPRSPIPGRDADAAAVASTGAATLDAVADGAAAVGGRDPVQLPPDDRRPARATTDAATASRTGARRRRGARRARPSPLDPSSAVAAGQADAFTGELRDGEDAPRRGAAGPAAAVGVAGRRPRSATGRVDAARPAGLRPARPRPGRYDGLEGSIGGYHDPTLAVERRPRRRRIAAGRRRPPGQPLARPRRDRERRPERPPTGRSRSWPSCASPAASSAPSCAAASCSRARPASTPDPTIARRARRLRHVDARLRAGAARRRSPRRPTR